MKDVPPILQRLDEWSLRSAAFTNESPQISHGNRRWLLHNGDIVSFQRHSWPPVRRRYTCRALRCTSSSAAEAQHTPHTRHAYCRANSGAVISGGNSNGCHRPGTSPPATPCHGPICCCSRVPSLFTPSMMQKRPRKLSQKSAWTMCRLHRLQPVQSIRVIRGAMSRR